MKKMKEKDKHMLASAGFDQFIKVWNLDNLSQIKDIKGHKGAVTCIDIIAQKYILSGSEDQTIKVWDLKKFSCIKTLDDHKGAIKCMAVITDTKFVSGSTDWTIKLWNMKGLACIWTFDSHCGNITCLLKLNDMFFFSGSSDTTIKIWDIENKFCVHTFKAHTSTITCLSYLEPRLASASWDECLRVWDLNNYAVINTVQLQQVPLDLKMLKPNLLAFTWGKQVKFWNFVEDHIEDFCLNEHTRMIMRMELVDPNMLVTASLDNDIKIWDLTKYTCIFTLTGHTDCIRALKFLTSHLRKEVKIEEKKKTFFK